MTKNISDQPKILMVAPQPYYEPRGILISIRARLLALSQYNCQVDLLTFPIGEDISPEGVKIIRSPRFPFIKSVPVGPSIRKLLLDLLLFFHLLYIIVCYHNEYDAIHTHEEASIFTIPLAKIFGLPLVHDYHSRMDEIARGSKIYGREPIPSLLSYFQDWSLQYSSLIISVLPNERERLEKVSQKTVHVIENLAPESIVNTSLKTKIADKLLANDNNKINGIYAGSLQKYQLIDLMLQGLKNASTSDKISLVIAGGNHSEVESLEATIESLALTDNVNLTGRLSHAELIPLLKKANFLISPRAAGKNIPLKIFTYLWCGKPIMATDVEAHRVILADDEALWAEPTPLGFKNAFEKLPQTNLDQLTRRTREKFEQHYSKDKFITKHKPYYKDLVDFSREQ